MAGIEQLPHQAQAQLRALVAKASRAPSTAPPGGSAATPLGTYAKSSSPPQDLKARLRKMELRAERYELLSVARDLLFIEARRDGRHQYASGFHRTSGCCYLARGSVDVLRDSVHNTAFFAGLTTCGSVWACPVCSAKIQERRRAEIAQAMERARAEGLQLVMVTLTHPHRAWHRLGDMLKQQADALRRLRSGKAWQDVKGRHGFQGLIRSLEVTHGRNGWHPHTHELWFVSPHCDAEELRLDVVRRWRAACQRAGLLDDGDVGFDEHSVDVRGWCDTSDYLAKMDDASHWGADREMAKASSKGSKGSHPFGLLARYRDGDERAGRLFVEYAKATKGKRQLYWSPGLKKRWGIEELSDEAIKDRHDNPADVLGRILSYEWRVVRQAGAQVRVLELAEEGGWPAVKELLEGLAKRIAPCNNKYITRQYVNGDGNGSEGRHNEEGSERRGADDTATRGNARSVRGDLPGLRHQRVEGDPALHSRDLGEGSPGQAEAVTQLGMAGI